MTKEYRYLNEKEKYFHIKHEDVYDVPRWQYQLLHSWTGYGRLLREIDYMEEGRYVTTYHDNDKTKEKYYEKADGTKEGDYRRFNTDGILELAENYTDGILCGGRAVYIHEKTAALDKVTAHAQHYEHGKRAGHWVTKCDFKILSESYYKEDGSETGFEIQYDEEKNPVKFRALSGDCTVEMTEQGLLVTSETKDLPSSFDARAVHAQALAYKEEIRKQKLQELQENAVTACNEKAEIKQMQTAELMQKINELQPQYARQVEQITQRMAQDTEKLVDKFEKVDRLIPPIQAPF